MVVALCLTLGCRLIHPSRPGPERVVVGTLESPLPAVESERSSFLWDRVARNPELRAFGSYTGRGWERRFGRFSDRLVRTASDAGLDAESLRRVLEQVLAHAQGPDGAVYLPVAAYRTTLEGEPVWAVAVRWEHAGMAGDGLWHIRVLAYGARTLETVGFCTCR